MSTVLVLNQDYAVLAVARVPRALALIGRGRAELLEVGVQPVQTPSCTFDRPAVIRLVNFVKRPRPRVRYSRFEIFKRDGHECQYCGSRPKELTIDHVLPTSRGGTDTWDNTVASCSPCNRKKGARTPAEARMTLRSKPIEPRLTGYLHLTGAEMRPEWQPFLQVV